MDAAAADERAQAGTLKQHVFTQRMQLRRTSPDVKQLVEDPRIGGLAAELDGVDAVRIFLDQALVKEPYGTPTQYHQDLPWFSFDSPHACTIWVALDDATLENGCLYFVPGSHLVGMTAPVDLGPDLGAVPRNPAAASMPEPCPLPAGGCRSQRPHGQRRGANMTPGRRRAMSVAFMPDGVRFNGIVDPRVLHSPYADGLAEGDRLENDELNPVVYACRPARAGRRRRRARPRPAPPAGGTRRTARRPSPRPAACDHALERDMAGAGLRAVRVAQVDGAEHGDDRHERRAEVVLLDVHVVRVGEDAKAALAGSAISAAACATVLTMWSS